MRDWKDKTTIEISTPDGKTTGPIPAKEFDRRVKQGLAQLCNKTEARMAKEKDEHPDFWYDNELDQIGAQYIKNHHPHLEAAVVKFLMTMKPMSRNGRAIAGKAKRASGLVKFFGRADFVVMISDDAWKHMDRAEREALVDHELSHCGRKVDDEGNDLWLLVGHDIEEFTQIVDRHGLWHDTLRKFGAAAARQLELPMGEKKYVLKKRVEQTETAKA